MQLTEDHVREALKKVIDPELFVNIVDLGLVYEVDIAAVTSTDSAEVVNDKSQFQVKIDMTMTSPMCPAGPQLVSEAKKFVGELDQVSEVDVRVVMDPPWTPDRMTDDARDQLGIF
ncbi:MAG TPA: metal-sulfur cluster assembly factor [Pirellulaceae bacterium]|nr:metal-sulfur cluster assembly factor [Pirellulaceae bacterium]HMO90774.1 metal-sulfur cluster assembly factor [Pirellulaceae bacterium]HMP68025.1 metal-sulfur cluster assembly factor [Pirellulaceae bacterium]